MKDDFNRTLNEFANKINKLETKFLKVDAEITALQSELKGIQETNMQANSQIIEEINERQKRSFNVMLYNIPESAKPHVEDRAKDDFDSLKAILAPLGNFTEPRRIIRVGKTGRSPRPMKIIYPDQELAKNILRSNKNQPQNSLRFRADRTPMQMNYIKSILNEFSRRKDGGEANITLKYINDVPTIVEHRKPYSNNTKN
ncbi:hypothetical protein RI129_010135 [Pyrocoelia pectoralis]|uniref:Uncharacterized protein n=1 Tax=Pyrocoelia pectoralis TaxID=417401 RepID=A0AAN7ZJP2_9COLE